MECVQARNVMPVRVSLATQGGGREAPGGSHPLERAALLGYASLNTVMVYTEPRLEDLAERMERIR